MNYNARLGIELRPIETYDDKYVVPWRNAARSSFFNTEVVTPDTHKLFVENRKPHDLVWMALDTHCSEPIGMVSLTVNAKAYIAEFGRLFVAPEHRSKGFGKSITLTAMSYGFDILRLCDLYLYTKSADKEALALYLRLGWETRNEDLGRICMAYSCMKWEERGNADCNAGK